MISIRRKYGQLTLPRQGLSLGRKLIEYSKKLHQLKWTWENSFVKEISPLQPLLEYHFTEYVHILQWVSLVTHYTEGCNYIFCRPKCCVPVAKDRSPQMRPVSTATSPPQDWCLHVWRCLHRSLPHLRRVPQVESIMLRFWWRIRVIQTSSRLSAPGILDLILELNQVWKTNSSILALKGIKINSKFKTLLVLQYVPCMIIEETQCHAT